MNDRVFWGLDPASQYHFHEWEEGTALFLEGENSISLINPFAAYLLSIFNNGQYSLQELQDIIRVDYPDDPVETLSELLKNTLAGLSKRGILIRTRS